ncbi:aminotransferase class V-fold PLP-dependent enzyme [Aquiflexum gelatinilyticum]|uniref:Aminotransferase class V-fold PLP-dependent enzyme n=1 Tax=Aquiflexum gelatinilyticum TaxID=2961943 RepID=A0A9X2P343_9BACT|nr:aminotransferase class V-fold PLP-dependent enzyme [Aquiflexum gelatinilyticum]MCR9014137.1 aminotransferase class V-fold PLP-dependent enzyme [Aquiflexum gelatinilyticum]
MKNQKHLFQLPEDIHYLNGAYMSPLLRSVEEIGIEALIRKRNPTNIQPKDFFENAEILKSNFGKLVNCQAKQVAIIPAASYGLSTAVNNLPIDNGNTALVVSDEFPSGYYAIEKWCRDNHKSLQTIKAPETLERRGEKWNNAILEAINDDTAVVLMSTIHWTDGTLFDLAEIGKKCKEHDAIFILDGTQSVGALPIDVEACQIDALICAGYKWLMGPYSIGLAYYSECFNNGIPLEETWVNRSNAQNFSGLTNYVDDYAPGAGRYNVGEYGNFILLPMMNAAVEQILEWKTENIQSYCHKLTQPLIAFLRENGYWVEEDEFRAKHLFGFLLPPAISQETLLQKLQENKIYVSVRGKAIRFSAHLYNTEEDIAMLIRTLGEV